ncbi:C4-dicarboxylate ABC transporter [Chelatococcus reniformis]|uniref:C4-dicarboxylate ABC transporter n=1 Tax=Chelatococcus reniformis TaxID=1494448 RepID=A0A916XBA4_9HYPH|nr:C4-dicarboxylate ABC transporter [Chelatococcus reniformis]
MRRWTLSIDRRIGPVKRAIAAIALVLATSAAGGAAAQQPIELKLLDRFPVDHYIARYATLYWIDEVQKATGGAVKIQRYPSESLGKSKDMLTLVKAGVTDMGEFFPGYLGAPMALSTIGELPGLVPNACAASLAYEELARPGGIIDKAELVPAGVRMLYVVGLPQYELFTSRKIESVASLGGLKIRSSGATMDAGLRSVGIVPIRMGAPELHESFSRKTVDGTAFPIASLYPYDLAKLVKYGTVGGTFGSSITFYGISSRVWDKLPAAVQAAMLEAGERTTRRACALIDRDNEEAFRTLEQGGATLVRFTPEQGEALRALYAPVTQEWATALDGRGKPGSEVLTRFREAVARGQ